MEALTRFGTYDPMCGNGKGVSFFPRSLRLCRIVTAGGRVKKGAFVTHLGLPAPHSHCPTPVLTNQHSLSLFHPSVCRPSASVRPSVRPFPYDQPSRCSRSSRAPLSPPSGHGGVSASFSHFVLPPPLPFPSLRRHSSAIDRQGRWTTFLRSFYAAYKAEGASASVARRGVMGL